jgi:DNA-binding transcriptional MocR family regulator
VRDGTLAQGDPMPSTRALAAELGVARGTVVAAYEQLDGEGWIRTRQGAAARVLVGADVVGATAAGADQTSGVGEGAGATDGSVGGGAGATDGSVADRPGALRRPGGPRGREVVDGPTARVAGVLDARPGIPSVTAISPRDWRAAWRAATDAPLRNGLSDPLGHAALRAQVAAQLGLTRGFVPPVDRVIVAAGTSEALSLVVEALRSRLGRAPRIAVEDPGYRSGRRALASAGAQLVGVPLDDDGLDVDALEADTEGIGPVDAVVVTPTHQYPLGSVMPVARRRRLLGWAARTGTLVVEDDYDSEFRHRGSPVPALAALDTAGVVLHVGGFSKTLDPRLRCSYLVLPSGDTGDAVATARTARGPVVAEPVQLAVAHLLRTGAFRRHLGRVRRDYTHRRERITTRLWEVESPMGLEVRAVNGGLHAVVTWSGPATGKAVLARMAAAGVLVSALDEYEVVPGRTPPGVVLGYGALTVPELDRALDVLVDAVRSAQRAA